MREVVGQMDTKKIENTEKVFDANRKEVTAKGVAPAIAAWECEVREYTDLAGYVIDSSLKIL